MAKAAVAAVRTRFFRARSNEVMVTFPLWDLLRVESGSDAAVCAAGRAADTRVPGRAGI
ncbi:hypothetical protein GCM10009603_16990 [Nocardiopsis exhalans]